LTWLMPHSAACRRRWNCGSKAGGRPSFGRITWAQLRELLGFLKVRQQLGLATALANLACW
jgi:hypothetical protein